MTDTLFKAMSDTSSMRKKLSSDCSKPFYKALGVSLMEMIFSLVIFSVIIFPMMMIPMKAFDQGEQAKNTNLVSFELGNLFDQLHQDINQSYRFLPLDKIQASAVAPNNAFNPSTQLFVAYWDNASKTEKRVGYMLKDSGQQNNAGQEKWQFTRVMIQGTDNIYNYQTNAAGNLWQTIAQIIDNTNFYVTGTDGTAPVFVYCQGNICGKDANNNVIGPKNADSVSLQSSQGAGIQFTYKNGTVSFPQPLYLKLASFQDHTYRQNAQEQILPFSTAINQWNLAQNWWLHEKYVSQLAGQQTTTVTNGNSTITSNTITENIPVDTPTDAINNNRFHTLNGFHYDVNTGELLAVSDSVPAGNNSTVSFYISKFKPGLPAYRSVNLFPLFGSIGYETNFPIIVDSTQTGIYNYTDPSTSTTYVLQHFIGVTQDNIGNLYVLAQSSAGYWVLKFSPAGNFMTKFSLGTDVSNAYGIAYVPGTPDEVLILLKTTGGAHVIRAYDRNSKIIQASQASYTSQSSDLGGIGNGMPGPIGYSWDNAVGFEYDPLHNRFIVAFQPGQGLAVQVLSMDAALATAQDGTPAQLAVLVQNIINPYNNSISLGAQETISGVGFDPLNNQIYLACGTTYYRIVPNVRLNRVRSQ